MATRKKAPRKFTLPRKSKAQAASEQKMMFKALQVIALELEPFDRATQGRIINAVEEITGIANP